MTDVRAQVLAVSRSRTGWSAPDSRGITTDPCESPLMSEKIMQENGNSSNSKRLEARRLGSKVSSIATMFQALAPLKSPTVAPVEVTIVKQPPLKVESPKSLILLDSSLSKVHPQKNTSDSCWDLGRTPDRSILESPSSHNNSSLSRSESQLSRFNNARAMFERLEERTKKPCDSIAIRRLSSGFQRSSSTSSCNSPTGSPKSKPSMKSTEDLSKSSPLGNSSLPINMSHSLDILDKNHINVQQEKEPFVPSPTSNGGTLSSSIGSLHARKSLLFDDVFSDPQVDHPPSLVKNGLSNPPSSTHQTSDSSTRHSFHENNEDPTNKLLTNNKFNNIPQKKHFTAGSEDIILLKKVDLEEPKPPPTAVQLPNVPSPQKEKSVRSSQSPPVPRKCSENSSPSEIISTTTTTQKRYSFPEKGNTTTTTKAEESITNQISTSLSPEETILKISCDSNSPSPQSDSLGESIPESRDSLSPQSISIKDFEPLDVKGKYPDVIPTCIRPLDSYVPEEIQTQSSPKKTSSALLHNQQNSQQKEAPSPQQNNSNDRSGKAPSSQSPGKNIKDVKSSQEVNPRYNHHKGEWLKTIQRDDEEEDESEDIKELQGCINHGFDSWKDGDSSPDLEDSCVDSPTEYNPCEAAGETLADYDSQDGELFMVEAVIERPGRKSGPFPSPPPLGDEVELMTQEEAERFLSTGSSRKALLSDEEAREVVKLLKQNSSSDLSLYDGSEDAGEAPYQQMPDGAYYFEKPGLSDTSEDDEETENSLVVHKSTKIRFSTAPIRVFVTHSAEDYDRRNEDVDPVSASAEYELEKRIEKMEVFPVDLVKGPEGLGLTIIGMGVGADAGLEKLGIFVKTITPEGAADKDKRIQVSDQIIEVDGKSLVGVTQAYAASVLRNTLGHVSFLIGREQDAENSEVAQLISQSLQVDKERELFQKQQKHYQKSQQREDSSDDESSLTPEEGEDGPTVDVYDLNNESSDSFSPDSDISYLKAKLKEANYKTSLAEGELKQAKDKAVQLEKSDSEKNEGLLKAQGRLNEVKAQFQQLLEDSQDHSMSLERKYVKAKKVIKNFQKREKELLQYVETIGQLQQEKDHEYNALVKTLKDRVIILEQGLADTQRQAGLPITLPYTNSVVPHVRPLSIAQLPFFPLLDWSDISDSEDSSAKRSTVERRPIEDIYIPPPTELLDTSAAKSKAELVNKSSLAHRQPPSSVRKSTASITESSVSMCSSEDNDEEAYQHPISPPVNFQHQTPPSSPFGGSLDSSNTSMTFVEEIKAAVLERQARVRRLAGFGLLEEEEDEPNGDEEMINRQLTFSPSSNSLEASPLQPASNLSFITFSSSPFSSSLTNSTSTSLPALSSDVLSEPEELSPQAETLQEKEYHGERRRSFEEALKAGTCLQPGSDRRSHHWQTSPVHEWTAQQVAQWLMVLGLDMYISKFLESDISGQILIQLDSNRLKVLGVHNGPDRALIKKKVKEIRSQLEKERKQQEKELRQREKLQKKIEKAARRRY